MAQLTYKDAGVDLGLYAEAMDKLPAIMRRTHSSRVLDLVGGFAGLFRLNDPDRPGARRFKDPVLVSGTDGAGTKVKLASLAGRFDTIGIDLVAMCVNDVLCLGAQPLFFLDYVAMDRDDPERLAALVKGVSDGCVEAGMALLALGCIERDEMFRAFNMGIGFVLVVSPRHVRTVSERLASHAIPHETIGSIHEGPRSVELTA